ncbi:MAG: hypothetical protein LBS85_02190, partial [Clostridiales Family XIII bacterium]|nr:hypothetical protein [Clostridiales Family XIII bacterium]
MKKKLFAYLLVLAMALSLFIMPAYATGVSGSDSGSGSVAALAVDPEDAALKFDSSDFTAFNVTVNSSTMEVRKYNRTYVTNPIAVDSITQGGPGGGGVITDPYAYEKMNIYVPESAYDSQTAPIYVVVNNTGWKPSAVKTSIVPGGTYNVAHGANPGSAPYLGGNGNSTTENIAAALDAGYVVIDLGSRGSTNSSTDSEGTKTDVGKSPAFVVDAKAAIRYLRLNDALMPGSAERIIINGHSGGGGGVVIVGASGNSPDYFPYLKDLGAAGIDANGNSTIRDDVFAVTGYAPITTLGDADLSYEAMFNTRHHN